MGKVAFNCWIEKESLSCILCYRSAIQRIFASLVLVEELIWWMNIAFNKTKIYKHSFQGGKKTHYSSPTAKDIFWWRKCTSFPIFWLFIYLFLVNLSVILGGMAAGNKLHRRQSGNICLIPNMHVEGGCAILIYDVPLKHSYACKATISNKYN